METQEALPQQVRMQWIHSVSALLLGLFAWILSIVGIIIVGVGATSGAGPAVLLLGVFAFLGGAVPAVVGVALGASAIRARGNHMILATGGLLLGGLHVGVIIGLFSYAISQI